MLPADTSPRLGVTLNPNVRHAALGAALRHDSHCPKASHPCLSCVGPVANPNPGRFALCLAGCLGSKRGSGRRDGEHLLAAQQAGLASLHGLASPRQHRSRGRLLGKCLRPAQCDAQPGGSHQSCEVVVAADGGAARPDALQRPAPTFCRLLSRRSPPPAPSAATPSTH